jgi:lipopolysaccharide export system permease protein
MKIINRYILNEFLRYLLICLAVLVFIYIVINLFDNLGKYLAKDVKMMDIVIYYLYLIPSYIILLIPVASIMAVFLIFGFMTKHRELIALKTAGLNMNRLFSLILLTGILIAGFIFVFQETIGIWAQARTIDHKRERIEKRQERIVERRRNIFYYGENDWVYFIKKFDGSTNTMDGIVLWSITKENHVDKRIDAQRATFDSIWIFEDATVREFTRSEGERVKVYPRLAMPELKEKPGDFLKRIKPLEEMNFWEIYQFVRKQKRAGEDVAKEAVELNYRFSYPIITIIILLIALPLSMVLKKGGVAIGLGFSIVLAFTYWGLIQSCRAYGVAGLISPELAAWFPNLVFGLIGLAMVLKVAR